MTKPTPKYYLCSDHGMFISLGCVECYEIRGADYVDLEAAKKTPGCPVNRYWALNLANKYRLEKGLPLLDQDGVTELHPGQRATKLPDLASLDPKIYPWCREAKACIDEIDELFKLDE